jgi:hypothetical protein
MTKEKLPQQYIQIKIRPEKLFNVIEELGGE